MRGLLAGWQRVLGTAAGAAVALVGGPGEGACAGLLPDWVCEGKGGGGLGPEQLRGPDCLALAREWQAELVQRPAAAAAAYRYLQSCNKEAKHCAYTVIICWSIYSQSSSTEQQMRLK